METSENDSLTNVYDLSLDELSAWFADHKLPAFRARQVYRQLYVNLVERFDEMTDLSLDLRQRLAQTFRIGSLELKHVQIGDGGQTRKALFGLPGGEYIETVMMFYRRRATVCVSSQAGCPMGCVFCATAKLGFMQDLSSGQIVEQVIWARRETRKIVTYPELELDGSGPVPEEDLPTDLRNVVFMGMGEPFNNFDPWWKAVECMHQREGLNFGARSLTVSTVGLVPGIRRLMDLPLQVNLAISLHASEDELRSEMMPVNRAFPIQKLLEACRDYSEKTGRRVSFEYVLLREKNDTPEGAKKLADLLAHGPMRDIRSMIHVNLIPWNPVPGSPLNRSSRKRVLAFQTVLKDNGIPCTIRQERGLDIAAACGQLAGIPK